MRRFVLFRLERHQERRLAWGGVTSCRGDRLKEFEVGSFLGVPLQGDDLLGLGPRGLFLRSGVPWDLLFVAAGEGTFSLHTAGFWNCSAPASSSAGPGSEEHGPSQHLSGRKSEGRGFPSGSNTPSPVCARCSPARSASTAEGRPLAASPGPLCPRSSLPAPGLSSRRAQPPGEPSPLAAPPPPLPAAVPRPSARAPPGQR